MRPYIDAQLQGMQNYVQFLEYTGVEMRMRCIVGPCIKHIKITCNSAFPVIVRQSTDPKSATQLNLIRARETSLREV